MIAAGTRIATPAGDRPAETLRAGETVHVLEGGRPVPHTLRWVGRVEVDLPRRPAPVRAAPVRLAAGALAADRPARDLLLSPDHAVLLADAMFQAQSLRNGATIVQDLEVSRLAYVHLELARHGLLLAEGAAVESFLDTGDHGPFAPASPRSGLPDLAAPPSAGALAAWRSRGCAPLRVDHAAIAAVHAVVVARASALGWLRSADPALAVLADDVAVPLASFSPELHQARLPAGTRAVRIASRSFVPAEHDPAIADRRRLGLAVRALRLRGRPLGTASYRRGWHAAEPGWRWTDGDGWLALRMLPQPEMLEIRTAPGAVPGYWVAPE